MLFSWLVDDAGGGPVLQEVVDVARGMRQGVEQGDGRGAARLFVDFWGGKDSWQGLPAGTQDAISARMATVLRHFEALFGEPLARWQVASLGMPMLFLCGARTVPAARRIAELLRLAAPAARHAVLEDMGHMGPITHAAAVNRRTAGFLDARTAGPARRPCEGPRPVHDRAGLSSGSSSGTTGNGEATSRGMRTGRPHVPILGCGTSIAEMFALGEAESDLSILIESYDWEIFTPLREDIAYDIDGMITAAERRRSDAGKLYDRIQFRFELRAQTQLCARSTITWHYTRDTL